jgi:hypothetical protein
VLRENVVVLIYVYKEEKSESRQANYLYSCVLSRRDSVAFPFLVHLAETMLGYMIPFVPTYIKRTLLDICL